LERVLGELGKTPYEPLKEEQEEGVSETMMEKHVITLNNTLINFFKGNVHNLKAPSSSTVFERCQICKRGDHLATTCSRLNGPQSNVPSVACFIGQNCGIKCSLCLRLGHSKDRCWKKLEDGKSHFGTSNFLEVLLSDEEVTMQQLNKLCGDKNVFFYT